MKWPSVRERLVASGARLFTAREFQVLTGSTPVAAKFLLIRYTKRGLLRRLRRGLYAVSDRLPSRWAIANRLYAPSYVSLLSALSYHGLIPDAVYAVSSVTTKATRAFAVDGVDYAYRTIRRRAFAGYRAVEFEGEAVLIAEPEKAAADYLYFCFRRKEPVNDRLDLDRVGRKGLEAHLRRFGARGLLEWCRHDLPRSDRRLAR